MPGGPRLLDMEHDLLGKARTTSLTMAEQIENVALICTNSDTCGGEPYYASNEADPSQNEAWLLMAGPTYQSDICLEADDATGGWRQESNRFEMDTAKLVSGDGWTINASYIDNHDSAAQLLWASSVDAANGQGAADRIPLHPSQAFLGIRGVHEMDDSPWTLYAASRHTGAMPRVRLGVKYSFYNTTVGQGSHSTNFVDFMECTHDEACIIGNDDCGD